MFRIIVPLHEAATATVGPPKVPKSHDDTLDDVLELRILSQIKMNPRINERYRYPRARGGPRRRCLLLRPKGRGMYLTLGALARECFHGNGSVPLASLGNQRELSQHLDISLPTIKRAMVGMVERHVIERKGGKRYGHWEIKARELRYSGDSGRT